MITQIPVRNAFQVQHDIVSRAHSLQASSKLYKDHDKCL